MLRLPTPTAVALLACVSVLPAQSTRTVELRSYNLVPGTRAQFRTLVAQAVPLVEQRGIEVVAHGPSLHDTTSYFLVRAFASLEDREKKEDAFYGSADWREGLRERVMALIQSYTTVVLSLSPDALGALRGTSGCAAPGSTEAKQAVGQLNQQYIDAARSGDHAWFEKNLSTDVVVILGGGRRLTKAEFVAMVRNGPNTTKSLTVRNVTLRAFGTTVQVDADAPWERLDGSRGVSRYIDTYAWIDCRWQVVSAQITLLPAT